MNAPHTFSSRPLAWLAPLLATALIGCAATGTQPESGAQGVPSGAPLISVPPTSVGAWVDLGHVRAPWLGGDAPVAVDGVNSPTRLSGLRREDGQWLALVIVQVAPAGSAPCPQPTSLSLDGGLRDACLRQRRDVDFDRWLEKQHPVLYHWLEARQLGSRPRAWASYRVPSTGRGAIETHAFVDPSLLEATSRNTADFLAAGQPGVLWAQRFAAATRAAGGSGELTVPPFPYGPAVAVPAAETPAPRRRAPRPVVQAPPTDAVQVTPVRPPAQAPRNDRE